MDRMDPCVNISTPASCHLLKISNLIRIYKGINGQGKLDRRFSQSRVKSGTNLDLKIRLRLIP